MTELKKCPFCGGEAKFTYSVNGSHMHIHCEDANCIGSTIMNDYETEAEAIEAWNNRATEAEIRNKAYTEFAEKLKEELRDSIIPDEQKFKYERKTQERICVQNVAFKLIIKLVDEISEQLKEE